MKKENKKVPDVYVGELNRFGYTLSCVGKTKKAVVDAIMASYEQAYRKCNDNLDPRKAHSYRSREKTDYTVARNDISVRPMNFGDVEWV